MFSQIDIKLLTSVLRFIEWLKELKISLETRYSHKGKWKLSTFIFCNTFKKEIGVLESSHKIILLSIYYTPIYLPLLKSQHITGICEIHVSFKHTR